MSTDGHAGDGQDPLRAARLPRPRAEEAFRRAAVGIAASPEDSARRGSLPAGRRGGSTKFR